MANVFKKQCIRINRGMIQLAPIPECGLVAEEDAQKVLERIPVEKNEEINRLTASTAERNKTVVELIGEREAVKARVAELKVQVPSDGRSLPATDSEDLQEEDAKEATVTDDKVVSVEDEGKIGKDKTSRQLPLC